MKISLNWLKTLLPVPHPASALGELLTAAGLEVESIEPFDTVAGGLKGLVVGEVIECAKHPDADRLSITKVSVGNGSPLSIVCGAPNVAAGQKVIVATVGTKLYPTTGEPFEIKKSKIRGQLSEGMICAEDEIGLGQSHAGIMVLPEEVTPGTPASEYFNVQQDEVLEIGLTPNRGDAASHYGVARDLAAILNSKEHVHTYSAQIPGQQTLPQSTIDEQVKIEVKDTAGCPRYSGLVISGIKVKESPSWLQNRLRSIGVRPINNIVDITNFVLHELGQPLHSFDLEKIKGKKIVVRRAKAGEQFVTLDGTERKLVEQDLMICDEKDPLCIAGVFGGQNSGVTEKTKSIFLESAYFDPSSIRRSAKHHGLKTDASFRFERGADPEMTVKALHRAAHLILELAGGYPASKISDEYPIKLTPYKVAFSYKNCSDLIGKDMDRHHVKDIILNLGIEIDSEGTDGLLLYVPRYKHDVTREADIIEEVLRVYGYDHIDPAKHLNYGLPTPVPQEAVVLEEKVGNLLAANGFFETMGLSLTSSSYYEDPQNLVKVLNPLSGDLDVLRGNLLFSALQAVVHNVHRQQHDLKLYELGKVYSKKGEEYAEEKELALVVTGKIFPENPHGLAQSADFSYLKTVLEGLFKSCGATEIKTAESVSPHFAFGLSFSLNNKVIAEAGQVNKKLQKQFDLKQDVFFASVDWSRLVKAYRNQKITYEEPSRFPTVRRDLALLIDRSVKYREIEDLAYSTEKKLLAGVNLFDIYTDEKLGNKKSYAVSFTLQDKQATLTDKQIDGVMEKLIRNYKEKLGAELH